MYFILIKVIIQDVALKGMNEMKKDFVPRTLGDGHKRPC
jgi:hypothetical protein